MESLRQRNERILKMREAGKTRREVAERFGVSDGLICAIEKRHQTESLMAERRSKIRDQLRQAEVPDKKWPIEYLLDAMNLGALFRKRLTDHFKKVGIQELSLRELIDLVVCESEGCLEVPLVKLYGIGKYGLLRVVEQLSEMDPGPSCNAIWTEKRAAFKRHWNM